MTDMLVVIVWIAGMAFAFWCGWYSMQAIVHDLTVSRDNLKNMLGTELTQQEKVIGQQEDVIAALEAQIAAVAALDELIRVGGVIKKGGDRHEWEIWSDLNNMVVVTTHDNKCFHNSTHERYATVLDAVADVLGKWQMEVEA